MEATIKENIRSPQIPVEIDTIFPSYVKGKELPNPQFSETNETVQKL